MELKLRSAGCDPQWRPPVPRAGRSVNSIYHVPVFVSSMVEVLLHVANTGAVAPVLSLHAEIEAATAMRSVKRAGIDRHDYLLRYGLFFAQDSRTDVMARAETGSE